MKALVIGHKGLIGSAVFERLQATCETIGVDLPEFDCTTGFAMAGIMKTYEPQIVVNCAYPRNFLDHVNCAYHVPVAACESMVERGVSGSVINMASIYGIVGSQPDLYEGTDMKMPAPYAFIKGGIIAHTKNLASVHGPRVRVNCISPGGVFDNQPMSFVDKYCERTPLNTMAEPADIADAVEFLASDKSKYITGHSLVVDGGFTCR